MDNKPKKSKEQIKEEQRQRGYRMQGNLIPLTQRSPEEQLAIRRKGQKAMEEVKRKRKNIKDIMEVITGLSVNDIANEYVNPEIVAKLNEVNEDITLYELVALVQSQKAIEGSTRSAEFIRDSAGDKPTDKIQADIDVITDNDRELLNSISDRLDSLEAIDPKNHI